MTDCKKDCTHCDGCGSSSFSPVERTCRACSGSGEVIAHDDSEVCAKCCPHDDIDHGICMQCETDLNDVLCNSAHERMEGDR